MIICYNNVTLNNDFSLPRQVSVVVRSSSHRGESQWLVWFPPPMPARGKWAWARASLWSDGKLDDIW